MDVTSLSAVEPVDHGAQHPSPRPRPCRRATARCAPARKRWGLSRMDRPTSRNDSEGMSQLVDRRLQQIRHDRAVSWTPATALFWPLFVVNTLVFVAAVPVLVVSPATATCRTRRTVPLPRGDHRPHQGLPAAGPRGRAHFRQHPHAPRGDHQADRRRAPREHSAQAPHARPARPHQIRDPSRTRGALTTTPPNASDSRWDKASELCRPRLCRPRRRGGGRMLPMAAEGQVKACRCSLRLRDSESLRDQFAGSSGRCGQSSSRAPSTAASRVNRCVGSAMSWPVSCLMRLSR